MRGQLKMVGQIPYQAKVLNASVLNQAIRWAVIRGLQVSVEGDFADSRVRGIFECFMQVTFVVTPAFHQNFRKGELTK